MPARWYIPYALLISTIQTKNQFQGAGIEVIGAIIVANAAFYLAFLKDVQRGHSHGLHQRTSYSYADHNV